MRKILIVASLVASLTAGVTVAEAKPGEGKGKANGNLKVDGGHGRTAPTGLTPTTRSGRCARVRRVGFLLKGTFVSGDATSVTLNATRMNPHARRSGLVTAGAPFTAIVSDPARIRYVNRTGPADAQPTDRVKVAGKVTRLRRGCPSDGFVPELTIKRVTVVGPELEEAAE